MIEKENSINHALV